MWHWMAFQTAVVAASWWTWPMVAANAPASWLRIWVPLVVPVRPPSSR